MVPPTGTVSIPTQSSVLQTQRRGQHLAVVDEEGYVSVINTAQQLPTSTGDLAAGGPRPAAHWVAHNNAIFDVKWCQVSVVDAMPSIADMRRLLVGAASQQLVRALGALLPQTALKAAIRAGNTALSVRPAVPTYVDSHTTEPCRPGVDVATANGISLLIKAALQLCLLSWCPHASTGLQHSTSMSCQ